MSLRASTGPAVIAAACWCAAGLVTVQDAASSDRLIVGAPWWVFPVALAAAFMVRGWRRHPVTALPALAATLPWWPVPLPAVAFMWSGPLGWAPILGALLAALITMRRPGQAIPSAAPGPAGGRGPIAAGAATFVLLALTAWSVAPRVPGGDEPHYLVITQSLLKDADVEIGNNHAARDYASFFAGELRPDYRQAGQRGEIYSVHAPGVAAVVLPGFALGGYRGAQITIILISAAAGALLWQLGLVVTGSRRAAWFAWAAVALTPAFLIQGVTIFPDAPGAFISAAALLLIASLGSDPMPSRARVLITSSLLAVFPWLHTRFSVIAAVLGIVILWQLVRRRRRFDAALFAIVPALSAIGWFGFFYALYGTLSPAAPYGPPAGDRSWTFIPGGVLGLLFDQQFGLMAYSPVLLVATLGVGAAARERRTLLIAAAAAALLYLAGSATYWMWWAGVPAPPARLATAVLPCFVVPLALAWGRLSSAATYFAATALLWSVSVTFLVIGIGGGALAWNIRDGQALWLEWLNPVVNLPRAWPSFFWRLTPGDVSTLPPYAMHIAVWITVIAAGAIVTSVIARRLETEGAVAVAAVAGFFATAMLVTHTGWLLNATSGFDPARSQLMVIGATQEGGSAWTIAAFRIGRPAAATGQFVIRAPEAPRFRPDLPDLFFDEVPAGDYEVTLTAAAVVTVRVDRSGEPIAILPPSGTGTTHSLRLEAAARRLAFDSAEPFTLTLHR